MIISGIQRLSLIDYPGKLAATIFTRGCGLKCGYCHNPELVLPELYQAPISEDYVIDFLRSRKSSLEGVVVTGGEPALQKDLFGFLRIIKDMGYLVKLDSSGVFPDILDRTVSSKLVDYIAMDIKAPFEKYCSVTGVKPNIDKIKRSIGIIKNSGIDYEFRTTVVRSQLSPEDIISIAISIKGARRYMLQRFVGSKTLDPRFAMEGTYDESELQRIKESISDYVGYCGIR